MQNYHKNLLHLPCSTFLTVHRTHHKHPLCIINVLLRVKRKFPSLPSLPSQSILRQKLKLKYTRRPRGIHLRGQISQTWNRDRYQYLNCNFQLKIISPGGFGRAHTNKNAVGGMFMGHRTTRED